MSLKRDEEIIGTEYSELSYILGVEVAGTQVEGECRRNVERAERHLDADSTVWV